MPSPQPEPSEDHPATPKLQAKPAAWTCALGGVVILASLAFGAAPLYVPGIGFLLLGVLTPLWVFGSARRSRVRRAMDTQRAVEEEPFEAIIDVRRGPFGLPGARVEDPLSKVAVSVDEARSVFGGRRRVQLRVVARLDRRGRHRFPPPSLSVGDALGLAQIRQLGGGPDDEVLVLPRTERVRWLRRELRRATLGQAQRSTQEPMGAGEIDGLRQYMPGTPASRIHWPALARGAGLLERRLVSQQQTVPMIVLDARVPLGAPLEPLDAAVRAAASLTLELARGGGCCVFLPGDRVPTSVGTDLGAWPSLHIRLALVEAETDQLRRPMLRTGSARGPVFYVAVRLEPHGSAIPSISAHASQVVMILPDGVGEQLDLAPAFTVTGCSGYVLRAGARSLAGAAA